MRILRNLAVYAAPLLLVGCFFLPNAVSGITDMQKLESFTKFEAQSLSLASGVRLGLAERLTLAANSGTESLTLKKGKAMDHDDAYTCAVSELVRFFGDSELGPELASCEAKNVEVSFIIDSEDPTYNMVAWTLEISDANGRSISVTLDDETGVILQLEYWNTAAGLYVERGTGKLMEAEAAEDALNETAARLVGLLSGYYGVPVGLDDYMRNGKLAYYRADLYSGTEVLPLYGVVRGTGFSMNEKV